MRLTFLCNEVRNIYRVLLIGSIQALINLCITAQDNSQISVILQYYPEIYRNPDGYINGRRNSIIYPDAKGTPFFIKAGESRSVLETIYGSYENLLLKYDMLNDEVLLGFRYGSGIEEIIVNRDIVLGFSLYGVKFVHLSGDSVPVPGYYEEVFNSRTRCYIKQTKTLSGTSGTSGSEYRHNSRKILVKDKRYFDIKNNRDLINLLGDKRNELKSFLRGNHILVRSATKEELIRVLDFYESL